MILKRLAVYSPMIAPFVIGLVADLVLQRFSAMVPILYLRADAGTFALLSGIFLSMILGAVSLSYSRQQTKLTEERSQAQLQAAEERRRFLQRLDHELKNPLTAIRAGLANLSEAPSSNSRLEALDTVEAQTLRLSRLASDLRKLAELETRPLDRSPVDFTALLEEVFALAQDHPEASLRKLTLTLPHAPWPLPKVSGDEDLLLLAMHNLVDNAIKFTRPDDTVEVRAFEDGANVVVEVADTGPGIPPEELPHVWEELYRCVDARGIPGSGLGLALVRAIAERHNGQVYLRSRAGQGTVFTIKIPVS